MSLSHDLNVKFKSNLCSVFVFCLVAQKSNEQANIVADSAVSGANEVAQATVEGVENAALASGFVTKVSVPCHRIQSQNACLVLLDKKEKFENIFSTWHHI